MRLAFAILLLIGSVVTRAATTAREDEEATPAAYAHALANAPRIGLVLGGGGARGAAHIGVLKVLEREHIPIHAIAGTSMGSIVGGLYAAGYTPDEIEALIASLDWKDFFSDDPARAELPMRRKDEDYRDLLEFKLGLREGKLIAPRGVLQGQKFLNLMRRMLLQYWDLKNFDDLPIPFRAVGTDIGKGEQVVFRKGDLALAIRASMSVPGAFAPIRVNGKLMVDGGIVNNVPVDVVKAMGVDRVIVVDVGEPMMAEDKLGSPLSITLQMITLLMKQRTDAVLAAMSPQDVLIRPDLGDLGSAEFDRALGAIGSGAAAAEAAVAKLKPLALPGDAFAAVRLQQRRAEFDAPKLEFVEVDAKRTRSPLFVHTAMSGAVGAPMDSADIEQRVGEAYGTGHYERILYNLERRGNATGLLVAPIDKGWGPNFVGFGLQLSDDFNGRSDYQLSAEATFTGLSERGAEARVRADLGRVAAISGEWYQPWGERGQYYWRPEVRFDARNQSFAVGSGVLEARLRRALAGARVGTNLGHRWRVEGGLEYGHNRAQVQTGTLPGASGFTSDATSFVFALDPRQSRRPRLPDFRSSWCHRPQHQPPGPRLRSQRRSRARRLASRLRVRPPSSAARHGSPDQLGQPGVLQRTRHAWRFHPPLRLRRPRSERRAQRTRPRHLLPPLRRHVAPVRAARLHRRQRRDRQRLGKPRRDQPRLAADRRLHLRRHRLATRPDLLRLRPRRRRRRFVLPQLRVAVRRAAVSTTLQACRMKLSRALRSLRRTPALTCRGDPDPRARHRRDRPDVRLLPDIAPNR
jgi:NTE family protein